MATEAKVRVRIDTKQAKKGLRDLGKEGTAAAGRIGRDVRGGLGRGFALGAGMALGVRAARSISAGGIGDQFSERTSGIVAQADALLGAPDARARKAAREEVKNSNAEIVGRTGSTADAKRQFDAILPRHQAREQGASDINKELGGYVLTSEEMEKLKALFAPTTEAITEGLQKVADAAGRTQGH